MTTTTAPTDVPSDAEVAEIEKRHEELAIMYGGEPWDESCVEDGERAHMDREILLRKLRAVAPAPTLSVQELQTIDIARKCHGAGLTYSTPDELIAIIDRLTAAPSTQGPTPQMAPEYTVGSHRRKDDPEGVGKRHHFRRST